MPAGRGSPARLLELLRVKLVTGVKILTTTEPAFYTCKINPPDKLTKKNHWPRHGACFPERKSMTQTTEN